jgi:hypothetical protein
MSASGKEQEEMMKYETAKELLLSKNKQAADAVINNNISKMEKIFKTGGIEQEAIDHLIFGALSVEMLKLFLRYGGDLHKPGPPLHPNPRSFLLNFSVSLKVYEVGSRERKSMVKIVEFLIKAGVDVNVVDEKGFTPFLNCAENGEKSLCELLVDRGADLSAKENMRGSAVHLAAARSDNVEILRYLVEDCGLGVDEESQDSLLHPRTPLSFAAQNGNEGVCRYLLEKGAKVDSGYQPLLGAAGVSLYSNHLERSLEHCKAALVSWR